MAIFSFDDKQTENIIKSLAASTGEQIIHAATQTLKAKTAGWGATDELLSLSACQIAIDKFGVQAKDIVRLARIFAQFSPSQRNKITNILGFNEQIAALGQDPAPDGGGAKDTTKSAPPSGAGQAQTQAPIESMKANTRGAKIIAMLVSMNDQDIKALLKGFGALDTAQDSIKQTIDSLLAAYPDLRNHAAKFIKALDDLARDEAQGNLKQAFKHRKRTRRKGLFKLLHKILY